MYDDYDTAPAGYPGVTSWYGAPPPAREDLVHLCPECRDLMSDVVSLARRLPDPEPEPDWSVALRWLDSLCGGRQAVLSMTDEPLTRPVRVPDLLPPAQRERLESCLTLLGTVADSFFDEEAGVALARALLRVHERAPGVVSGAPSAAQLALGVVWAVGHANGLLHPRGVATEKELKRHLELTQSGSTLGAKVCAALAGPYAWDVAMRPWSYGGYGSRELKALGHTDLLVSGVRRQLVAVRDRALDARQSQGVPPTGPA